MYVKWWNANVISAICLVHDEGQNNKYYVFVT
jgi:hypothetical protein